MRLEAFLIQQLYDMILCHMSHTTSLQPLFMYMTMNEFFGPINAILCPIKLSVSLTLGFFFANF